MSETDLGLLRRYVGDRAEDAFAALVRRHLGLVYSAALRQVRAPPLAEDIAQTVFTDLARSADKLRPDTILTAWLYQVTRRTAIDVVRREARRQFREQIAAEMNAMNAERGTGFEPAWKDIEPLLDEAMDALDATDRAAVLLRYFENKSLREVGQQLGVSDDAAQKRVRRAVDRLREFFAKRGVTVGASGLAVIISANAAQAVPVGLAVTISTTAAVVGTTTVTTATATAIKAIAMTTLQKTILGATLAAAIGSGIYEAREASTQRTQVQTLKQQQAPLAEQVERLNRDRDSAMRRLTALRDENERLNQNTAELLQLRGEVTRLRKDAQAVAQTENDPTVQLARAWRAKETKLRQLFEQRPDQRIPEMRLLTDEQWLDVAKGAELDSPRGIRLALSRMREVATLNFSTGIQQALHTYMNANNDNLPDNPSQLAAYFKPPVEDADAMLSRYEMLGREAQTNEAFKGAAIIEKVLVDGSVDNALIVGVGTISFAPKPGQGHAPVDVPRELLPVFKSYMDANNHTTPLDLDELKPYITTPEQKAALDNFIKAAAE